MISAARAARRARSFLFDDGGQGLVEYALVIATVSLVAIAALNLLVYVVIRIALYKASVARA